MAEKKPVTPTTSTNNNDSLFGKQNYVWIIAGLVAIALGLMLMAGGKSDDPNVFNANEVYSFRRITLAPILILIGLALEVVAIFRKPKA